MGGLRGNRDDHRFTGRSDAIHTATVHRLLFRIHGSGPNTSQRDRRAHTFAFDHADNWLLGSAPVGDGDHDRCGARR
jgi:hypothetical protein